MGAKIWIRGVFSAALFAGLCAVSPAQAEYVLAGVLDEPGKTAQISAGASRIIASYQSHGGDLDLTLLLSGPVFGPETVRAAVTLTDGQRHSITLHGASGSDRVVFLRHGMTVVIATEGLSTASASIDFQE